MWVAPRWRWLHFAVLVTFFQHPTFLPRGKVPACTFREFSKQFSFIFDVGGVTGCKMMERTKSSGKPRGVRQLRLGRWWVDVERNKSCGGSADESE